MPNDQFSRLVRFAQRTGDRLIVTDPEGREPVVIMSLDEYESLLDGAMGPGKSFTLPSVEEGDDELPEFVPPLEVIEDTLVAENGPDTLSVQPVVARESRSVQEHGARIQPEQPHTQSRKQMPGEPGEEQFYLEPL